MACAAEVVRPALAFPTGEKEEPAGGREWKCVQRRYSSSIAAWQGVVEVAHCEKIDVLTERTGAKPTDIHQHGAGQQKARAGVSNPFFGVHLGNGTAGYKFTRFASPQLGLFPPLRVVGAPSLYLAAGFVPDGFFVPFGSLPPPRRQVLSRVAKTFSAVVDLEAITLTINRDQPRLGKTAVTMKWKPAPHYGSGSSKSNDEYPSAQSSSHVFGPNEAHPFSRATRIRSRSR